MWPCGKAVMCESFPLIVLWHQQTAPMALWGCFLQDMLSSTLAVSNAEAILLFYASVYATDKCPHAHIVSCFLLTCSSESSLLKQLWWNHSCPSVRDEVLSWVIISDSAGAGCGCCLTCFETALKSSTTSKPQDFWFKTKAWNQLIGKLLNRVWVDCANYT